MEVFWSSNGQVEDTSELSLTVQCEEQVEETCKLSLMDRCEEQVEERRDSSAPKSRVDRILSRTTLHPRH